MRNNDSLVAVAVAVWAVYSLLRLSTATESSVDQGLSKKVGAASATKSQCVELPLESEKSSTTVNHAVTPTSQELTAPRRFGLSL